MSGTVKTTTEIRPFHVDIPDEALDDLRRRIAATQWPEKETVADESQGVPLAMIQKLARYWATDYDWRRCEAKLNARPQFMTELDGLEIHFIHVRSRHEDALPLVVNHLIHTKYEPLGVLPFAEGGGYTDVPSEDLRALRRAILDLDEFHASADGSEEGKATLPTAWHRSNIWMSDVAASDHISTGAAKESDLPGA
jgi:hypothetical protein